MKEKRKHRYMNFSAIMLVALLNIVFFTSCSNENDPVIPTEAFITLVMPQGYEEAELSEMTITLTNINTQKQTSLKVTPDNKRTLKLGTLTGGYYRVNVTGEMTYRNSDLLTKKVDVLAYSEGITLTSEQNTAKINLQITSKPEEEPADVAYNGFVLAEIFCAGTANAQGSYYYADKYFVIYNNTDHILYADSLLLAESTFMTTMKEEYKPDIMSTDMAVSAIYMIPGSGHDVPVQPGGKLLITDNAVNHTVANPNSWNLTTADYEWYDESTNPEYTDIDNPKVPNLERIYSSTLTTWSPHTQGFKSYALARMHTDKITYIVDYIYDYTYHLVGAVGEADMVGSCYRLPNSWIIDAVNMSTKAGFQWIVTSPTLDRGYTYNSDFNWDDTRFGKSVRRKVLRMEGQRAVLQDTNNSSEDFLPRVQADPFYVFKAE